MIDLATTERQFLRPAEVADLFGVSIRTVYYWIQQRHFVVWRPAGRGSGVRIPVSEIKAHLVPRRDSVQSAEVTH